MLIDVHCHLTGNEYETIGDVEDVLRRASDAGVHTIICSAFDLESSYQSARLCERFDNLYFCAGFHPGELHGYHEGDLDKLAPLLRHEKCVAVGEIGLDYHFDNNPSKELQKEIFVKQLHLAKQAGLPVVLHSRDAAQDTVEILEAYAHCLQKGGLLHCYSYSPEMVDRFLKLGLYFSFGGTATFKNAKKVWDSVQSFESAEGKSVTFASMRGHLSAASYGQYSIVQATEVLPRAPGLINSTFNIRPKL